MQLLLLKKPFPECLLQLARVASLFCTRKNFGSACFPGGRRKVPLAHAQHKRNSLVMQIGIAIEEN